MSYPWYRIPDRLALGIYALAASVWRDWFPPKTCDQCKHYAGRAGRHCYRQLGYGYGRPAPDKFTCEHWEKRQ